LAVGAVRWIVNLSIYFLRSLSVSLGSCRNRKQVSKIKSGDVFEIILIPGHQRNAVNHSGSRDYCISYFHFLLLAQVYRLLDQVIIKRVDGAAVDEIQNGSFLLW